MKTRSYKHWLWICAAWLTACYTIDAQASDGVREWSRIWGSPTVDVTKSCATDAAGDIYIAGRTFAAFDGQSLAGSSDACLRKYNAAGVKQWTRIWGSTNTDFGPGLAADTAGNIYVAGQTKAGFDGQTTAGYDDMFLSKFMLPEPAVWRLLGLCAIYNVRFAVWRRKRGQSTSCIR